jgi:hypothetical protein
MLPHTRDDIFHAPPPERRPSSRAAARGFAACGALGLWPREHVVSRHRLYRAFFFLQVLRLLESWLVWGVRILDSGLI